MDNPKVVTTPHNPDDPSVMESTNGTSLAKAVIPTIQHNAQNRAKSKHLALLKEKQNNERLKRINDILTSVPNDSHFDMNGDNLWHLEREELEDIKGEALARLENYDPPAPYMIGVHQAKMIMISLENGCSVVRACAAAKTTVPRFHALMEADSDFREAVILIRDSMAYAVEDALFYAATHSEVYGSVTAGIYISKNRMPDRYNDKPSPRAKERPSISDDELSEKIDRLQASVDGAKRKLPIIDAEGTTVGRIDTNDTPDTRGSTDNDVK